MSSNDDETNSTGRSSTPSASKESSDSDPDPRQPVRTKHHEPHSSEDSSDSDYKPPVGFVETSLSDSLTSDASSTESTLINSSDPGQSSSSDSDNIRPKRFYPYKITGTIAGTDGDLTPARVDPFLSSLKVWSLRTRYDFSSNFKHTYGNGLDLENCIRFAIDQLKLLQPISKIQPMLETRQSTDILNYLWLQIVGPVQNPFLSSRDPMAYPFEHIHRISGLSFYYSCLCQSQPVYHDFSSILLQSQNEVDAFRDFRFIPHASRPSMTCPNCHDLYTCNIVLPAQTWAFIANFSPDSNLIDTLPIHIDLGEEIFSLAFSTYHRTDPAAPDTANPHQPVDVSPPVPGYRQPSFPPSTVTPLQSLFSQILVKNTWYRYSATDPTGRLNYSRGRFPTKTSDTRLLTSVYFRRPPLLPVPPARPTSSSSWDTTTTTSLGSTD